jgi:hypothetical protein
LGNIFKMILKVARWSKLPTFTVLNESSPVATAVHCQKSVQPSYKTEKRQKADLERGLPDVLVLVGEGPEDGLHHLPDILEELVGEDAGHVDEHHDVAVLNVGGDVHPLGCGHNLRHQLVHFVHA